MRIVERSKIWLPLDLTLLKREAAFGAETLLEIVSGIGKLAVLINYHRLE